VVSGKAACDEDSRRLLRCTSGVSIGPLLASILHPMPALPRVLLLSLVWLMVALLPLRGWAQVQMQMQVQVNLPLGIVQGSGGPADADLTGHHPAGHPLDAAEAGHCDAMIADDGAAADPDHDHAQQTHCTLCVVCHASLAAGTATLAVPAVPPGAALPGAAPGGIPEGAASDLFRPPRTTA
jgi:cytochrome c553